MPTAPGPRANPVCVGGFRAGGGGRKTVGGWFITRSLGEGWSNPHRPRMETISVIRRIGRMNAHRLRAPRKHSLRGWIPGGGGRS